MMIARIAEEEKQEKTLQKVFKVKLITLLLQLRISYEYYCYLLILPVFIVYYNTKHKDNGISLL